MAIFLRTPNPNIHYNGKTLPKDKAPARSLPVDPDITYNGGTLPADKIVYVPFIDSFNTPGEITLITPSNSITLPPDTKCFPHGAKHLAMTPLLDAEDGQPLVVAFERIQRKPYKIEIEGTFRMQNQGGTTYENTNPPAGLRGPINNVFAQQSLNAFWNGIWLIDTVVKIKNSYLNGLGIQEIVIEDMTPEVVRGSTNIPFHITAWENVPGQSLIIV